MRVQPVQRRRPHQRVHLALRGHAPHDRQVVARLPLVQDRRPPLRGVGLDHPRQEVESRLVHENKGPALAAGLLLQRGPRLDPPAPDRLLVPLDRPGDGDLRGPSQALEQPRHLALAVRDAELLAEDSGDPLTGPDVAAEAVGLGAMPEEVGDQPELLGGELGGRARAGVRAERLRTAAAGGGEPTTDGTLRGVEGDRDVALLPALSREIPVPSSAATPSSHEVECLRIPCPIVGPGELYFSMQWLKLRKIRRSRVEGGSLPPCRTGRCRPSRSRGSAPG